MKVKELVTPKMWPGGMGDGLCRIKGTVVGDSIWIKHRDLEALGEQLVEHGQLAEDEGFEGEDEEFDPDSFVSRCRIVTKPSATPQPVGEMRELIRIAIYTGMPKVESRPDWNLISEIAADAVIAALASATDGEVDAAIEAVVQAGISYRGHGNWDEVVHPMRELKALIAARALVPATPEGGRHDR